MGAIPWLEIGTQAADLITGQLTSKQQYERQKKLMDIQVQNQQKLNQQGQQLQMQTWEQTNYPAQMEMLKKAGLNPSLMYSKGGAGGTTGGQGGGSAANGTAQMANSPKMMDIISMQSMKAGIEAQQAQARKANAEADVIEKYGSGKSEAEIGLGEAQAGKAAAETELAKVNARIREIEEANTQTQIDYSLKQTAALTNKLVTDNEITQAQANSLIKRAAAEAIGATLENELTKSKTNLTETEIKAINTGIVQKWTELSQKQQGLNIETFRAELQAEYPKLGEIGGQVLNKVFKTLNDYAKAIGFGGSKYERPEMKK